MFSLNNKLDEWVHIKNKIHEFEGQAIINYIEVEPWFKNLNSSDIRSPEGHTRKKWHFIIGKNLSSFTTKLK